MTSKKTKKKNVLLLVETSRAFGRGLIQGVSRYILEYGDWNVHIEDRGLLESAPFWLNSWSCDGIISRTSSFKIEKALRKSKASVVELMGNGEDIKAEIRNDEDAVAAAVYDHFERSGFQEFGFFAIGNAWWSTLRQEAFTRIIAENGKILHVFSGAGAGKRVFYPVWEPRYDAATLRWLRRLPKPIAIWAVSDFLAVRLLDAARRLGFAVPEEIAILGTTNDPILCSVLTPSLSSVDLNSFRIGYLAAERLDAKMRGDPVPDAPILVCPNGVVARQSSDVVSVDDAKVAAALSYIREYACSKLSVDGVAETVHLSRSTLQRKFRQCVGRTVAQEILRIRMDHAKRLLLQTDFSLSAIARKIGFATTDYFVQAFRRENGLTPRQYQRQNQTFRPTD